MKNKDWIEKLTKEILTFRENRNWKQYHSPKNMVISFSIEIAELAEHFQYGSDQIFENKNTYTQEIADELVDVLWWTLLMSHEYGIDPKKFSPPKSRNTFKPRISLMKMFVSIGKISSELVGSKDVIRKKYTTKNKNTITKELENIFNQVLFFSDFIKMDIEQEFFRKLTKNAKRYPVKSVSFLQVFSAKLYKNV